MKFIFPKNFDFKNKLFGVIDYSTVFMNIFWIAFVFIFLSIFFQNFTVKLFLLILICFPFLLFSISGFNGENFLYVFEYIISFLIKQKLFFYLKN